MQALKLLPVLCELKIKTGRTFDCDSLFSTHLCCCATYTPANTVSLMVKCYCIYRPHIILSITHISLIWELGLVMQG